jgi:UDPglucose 6-dehydrogenase
MKIAVAGTGYVGLVSGVCLSEKGHHVTCVDMLQEKVDKINNGIPPIYELGLEELLKKNIGKNLVASTNLHQAILDSDMSLIAVGTPFDGQEIDVSYIKQVSKEIGQALKVKDGYHLVVVKSTVVPGTTENVVLPILEAESGKKAGVDFGVGMNPEFLREGDAISDFMNPDRIVLGGIDARSQDVLGECYGAFTEVDKLRTSPRTAEMIKYTANSLLATLISFSNEIGNLCAAIGGIDALEVMKGVHLDKRFSPILESGERITPVSTTYLEAGCGFGGSCFPKDVKALISHGKKYGQNMAILDSVIEVNRDQPDKVLQLIGKHYPDLKDVPVAVLGLAFKPGTDDMRESPAIPVVQSLLKGGAKVSAFDPIAEEQAKLTFNDPAINYCDSIESTVNDAKIVVIMTRWPDFKNLAEQLNSKGLKPLVVDGRRMLDKNSVEKYEGIGL